MRSLCLAVAMGFAAALISIGLLGVLPALARESEITEPVGPATPQQGPWDPPLTIEGVVTLTLKIEITDLAGNPVGEGQHGGRVSCNSNGRCTHATELQLNGIEYMYRFEERQAVDPSERTAVAEGTGTIDANGKKERFLFTATFEDNRDGTLAVRYEASRPDASYIVPKSPGTLEFQYKR
jgi:hypothetical protein